MFVCQEKTLDFLICFVTETPKSIRFLAEIHCALIGWKKAGKEHELRQQNLQNQIKPSVLLLGSVYIAASQMLLQEKIIFNNQNCFLENVYSHDQI